MIYNALQGPVAVAMWMEYALSEAVWTEQTVF